MENSLVWSKLPITCCLIGPCRRDRLSWEQVAAVHFCAAYWHFLEAVWVVLFGLLLITA